MWKRDEGTGQQGSATPELLRLLTPAWALRLPSGRRTEHFQGAQAGGGSGLDA